MKTYVAKLLREISEETNVIDSLEAFQHARENNLPLTNKRFTAGIKSIQDVNSLDFSGSHFDKVAVIPSSPAEHVDFSNCSFVSLSFASRDMRESEFVETTFDSCRIGCGFVLCDFSNTLFKECTFFSSLSESGVQAGVASFTKCLIDNLDFSAFGTTSNLKFNKTKIDGLTFQVGYLLNVDFHSSVVANLSAEITYRTALNFVDTTVDNMHLECESIQGVHWKTCSLKSCKIAAKFWKASGISRSRFDDFEIGGPVEFSHSSFRLNAFTNGKISGSWYDSSMNENSFLNVDFSGSEFELFNMFDNQFHGCNFDNCKFVKCHFTSDEYPDPPGGTFEGCSVNNAEFSGCVMTDKTETYLRENGAILTNCRIAVDGEFVS